ncbi:MAG: biotin--[acetyl-CoA-carboxylase] ligase [Deinococcales bacterium]|jgi:BirA family biotin operon repressor/biotin-[acetyl-CoA-carboxylase] ligase
MPLAIAFRIEAFDTLASTQGEVRARLERGEDVDGLVVRAGVQTQGRGRRGRSWTSATGGSYQTLAVRDPEPPLLGRGGSAVAVAVGLAETFGTYGLRLGIKWPNDLVYRGRKLGGILTEYLRGHLLVGVGVNVANEPPEGATSLRGWDPEGVSGAVLAGIQHGLDSWLEDAEALPARFRPFDVLAERAVSIDAGGRRVSGIARGIDGDGCLLLAPSEAQRDGAGGNGAVAVCSGSVVRGVPPPP